ncbi:phage virion morphogenesis protein [Pectobacterium aquaticum]|uniref:Phage virion morphogenesis protein n=1 Tax=Pectobacterium aquaticum TaxID=2204145 RepID=A0A426JFS2_9GAMM|nr:phage virion morphogenesis protein [Pectobacterium aquaticum]RRO12064.1 phage virion morphogenesis protein [Pectobacterium aquaticum]
MSQNDALFQELDGYLEAILRNIEPNNRRRLARQTATGLRKRQQQRITKQKNPDGSNYSYRSRKRLHRKTQGGVRFLWNDQVRELKNWSNATGRNGRRITGYDPMRGELRSFLRDDIDRYLSIDARRSARPTSFKAQMFRKLRTIRFLRTETSPNSAAVGFSGKAAQIARIHQFGEMDDISDSHVRYPVRQLLGLTPSDLDWLAETITDFIQPD